MSIQATNPFKLPNPANKAIAQPQGGVGNLQANNNNQANAGNNPFGNPNLSGPPQGSSFYPGGLRDQLA